ncbi:protein kinase [Micromonospora sp. NBC_00389]|uniref:protein kinase domain-containing protein n=1 Tax=Micromonospora sp. NBC_00389 TaxID=2903586 RepID=UPI002E24DED3
MVHSKQPVTYPESALGVDGCTDAVEVGRGGFGLVYQAWQPTFSRWVAVKVLAADWHGPSRARFERELRVLGRLSDHPHIVTLHQAGRTAPRGHDLANVNVLLNEPHRLWSAVVIHVDDAQWRLSIDKAGTVETPLFPKLASLRV